MLGSTIWQILSCVYGQKKNELEKQAQKYNPRHIIIEDKASGQSLIQDLSLSGYSNIKPSKAKLDKITRFASVIPLFQAGKVFFPSKSAFNRELINELTTFPNSKNDDIVDSVSQFLNFCKELSGKTPMRIRIV